MAETDYQSLPTEIRSQIDAMLSDSKGSFGAALSTDDARELLAANWHAKFELFNSQTRMLGLEDAEVLDAGDTRALIALSWSGSLLTLGPAENGSRWLEYASIKMRSDVPGIVSGRGAVLGAAAGRDRPLAFSSGPIETTSKVYRLAVCPAGMETGEQDRRVREAAIYITNGFIKLNRNLTAAKEAGADQFTLNAMARYVAGKNGLTIAQTRQVIDDFLATAESGLLLGERVSLGRLGRLSLKLMAPRKARVIKNPRTGEDVLIPAKGETAAPKISFPSALKDRASLVDTALLGADEDGEDE